MKSSTAMVAVAGIAVVGAVAYFLFFRKGAQGFTGPSGSSGGGGGGNQPITPVAPGTTYKFGGQTVTGGNPYTLPMWVRSFIGPYTPGQALSAVSQSMAYPQLANQFEANIENAQASLAQQVFAAGYRYPTPAPTVNIPLVTQSQQQAAIAKAVASGVSPRGI
jgi:hypothetical protein